VHSFGNEVSISGEHAIIGVRDEVRPTKDANGNNLTNGTDAGAAYIFSNSEGSWMEQAKLVPSQYQDGDRFGSSVKISGDFAIVGADGRDDLGMNSGSAYIFRRNGDIWTQQTKLVGVDTGAGDRFGMSVALSGDTALVGAFWHTGPGGSGSGAAYVFVYDGQNWTQQAKLVANDSMTGDSFGLAVGLDGDIAIIGAPEVAGRGAAYIFERSGTTWSQQVKWVQDPLVNASNDRFGSAVSVSAGTAVVGAYWDDEQALNSGAAFIYTRNESGWFMNTKILPPGGINEERFGISVDVSRNTLIIGSHFDNDQATYAGSAYIYVEVSKDVWTFKEKLFWSQGRQSYYFGRSVAIWDSGYGPYTCAVGAPGANSTVIFDGDIPTTTTSTTATRTATSSTTTSLSSTSSSSGTGTTTSSTATSLTSTSSSSISSSTSTSSATTTSSTNSATTSTTTLSATSTITSSSSSTSQSSSSTTTVTSTLTTETKTTSTSSTHTVSSSTATSSTATYTTATTTSATMTTSTFTSYTVTNTTATQTSSTSSTGTKSTSTATTYTATTSTTRTTITLHTGADIAEQVSELFEEFQRDGTMTAGDFKDLLDALGLDESSDTDTFSGADTNGDGKLELQEVQQALKERVGWIENNDLSGACTRMLSLIVQLVTLAAVLGHA